MLEIRSSVWLTLLWNEADVPEYYYTVYLAIHFIIHQFSSVRDEFGTLPQCTSVSDTVFQIIVGHILFEYSEGHRWFYVFWCLMWSKSFCRTLVVGCSSTVKCCSRVSIKKKNFNKSNFITLHKNEKQNANELHHTVNKTISRFAWLD